MKTYPQDLSVPLEDYPLIIREPNADPSWPPLLCGHRSLTCWSLSWCSIEGVTTEQALSEIADGVEFCRCDCRTPVMGGLPASHWPRVQTLVAQHEGSDLQKNTGVT